ncbi:MAG: TetR/AcrR family transcriptional regulator [Chloroflexota bacterium]|nr:TetR/AcrR family transcriptional regulator [Chloroflexota bacterium]
MSPRPDVSEERKNQIMEAAQKIFSKLGFHKARMSDIAQEADLSKGSLYWYFKSKNEIIINVLDNIFEAELKSLQPLIDADSLATEKLHTYTDRVINDMKSMLKWMPLAYDFVALAFRQETVQIAIRKYYNAHMNTLTPIIQQGLDSGEFTAPNAEDAAIALGAIMEGVALLWVYDSESIDIEKHIRSSVQIMLNGLKTPLKAE